MSAPPPAKGPTAPPPNTPRAASNTIRARTRRRRVGRSRGRDWEATAAVAAVVAAVVAVLAFAGSSDDAGEPGTRNRNCTMDGQGNTMGSCVVEFRRELGADPSEAAARAEADRYADVDPTGDGPWPFFVLDTGDGLKVRTSGGADGVQVGSADDGTIVYVECRERTGFEPNTLESRNRLHDRWLRILWPNQEPTSRFLLSSPGDQFTAYVYEGFVIPAGHNGDIPDC